MALDLAFGFIIVVGFFVGFFRGVIRTALAVAAWPVAFLIAIYVKPALADWLVRNGTFSPAYADLLSFMVIFGVTYMVAVLLIMLGRAPTALTKHPLFDDISGGAFGVVAALCIIAALIVMINSYYAGDNPATAVDLGWTADLRRSLTTSAIASFVHANVMPILNFALGPLLPSDIRAVMV